MKLSRHAFWMLAFSTSAFALDVELPENETRHHLDIETTESVYLRIKNDAVLTGRIKTTGSIYLQYEGAEEAGNSLRFDPTLSITGIEDSLPKELDIKNFGDTYFQTDIHIAKAIEITYAPGARIEVSKNIQAGSLNIDSASDDHTAPNETQGVFILGGTKIDTDSINIDVNRGKFYASGGSFIDSYFFWLAADDEVLIEAPIETGFLFNINGWNIDGGKTAEITLNAITQEGPSFSGGFIPPHFSILGKTINLYGDINTTVGNVTFSADTINLYGRTIGADPKYAFMNINSPNFNAYGGRITMYQLCLNGEINDYGLEIENTTVCQPFEP